MRKIIILLFCVVLLGVLANCDTSSDETFKSNSAVPNNEFNETATIQGTVFDAITGARAADSSLTLTLVRGSTYAAANMLKTEGDYAGDFVFNNVPVTQAGVATYRVVATMDNYQTFEGYIALVGNLVWVGGGADTVDGTYNFIGNIYMFPTGSYASDQTIYVEYDSERVEGATVLFELQGTTATTATTAAATVQPASAGLNQALSGTTDANGLVAFDGDNLVLGGTYTVTVLPLVYEGVQLATAVGGPMVVGAAASDNVQVIAMVDEVPGTQGEGLFVTYASNRDPDDILSTGVLTVVFNRPIALVSEDNCLAVLTIAVTGALDVSDTPDSTVDAEVSADGYTLTLTPNFAVNLADTDLISVITYTGVEITAGDDLFDALDPFLGVDGILYADGSTVSNIVNVSGPQTD